MLNKLKSMLAVIGIKPSQDISTFKPNATQEDQRDTQAKKRVANYIEENRELILARGLKPHSAECLDPDLCTKEYCWKFVPDKIVGGPYVINTESREPEYITRNKRLITALTGEQIKEQVNKNYEEELERRLVFKNAETIKKNKKTKS